MFRKSKKYRTVWNLEEYLDKENEKILELVMFTIEIKVRKNLEY
ncbi:MAG: hypothetical protein Q6368_009815 [Candidatus Baldrarchaeota archaeon]